ncbi:hypothetical protein [Ottowia thiooxydans]|uniref:Lipoprotein n=1 Tax=Ottowia thiooxydans TaxID=219182 RepID=A0ABV2QGS3_9BURK
MKLQYLSALVLMSGLLGACGTPHHELVASQKAVDAEAARTLVAGAPPDDGLGPWLEGHRTRISAAREAVATKFADAEKLCWQRFTVNDCIRGATDERRSTLDKLRQEELALNDLERRRRAENRLRNLEQKQRDGS